jgi:CspA family cold shock protein
LAGKKEVGGLRMLEGTVIAENLSGVCKWFNNTKGFGFLIGEEGKDIFAHYSCIVAEGYKTLNEGDKVSYTLVQTPRGLQAANIIKIVDEAD